MHKKYRQKIDGDQMFEILGHFTIPDMDKFRINIVYEFRVGECDPTKVGILLFY